jgi:Xaa-Pro dipeptidase
MIAEQKALQLFEAIDKQGLIVPGKTEKQLNREVYDLAFEMFGVKKHWHKRIVRSGKNTLEPYKENPADLVIQEDDILFLDFGPVFDEWEADVGRTYVVGDDPYKRKLAGMLKQPGISARNFTIAYPKLPGSSFMNIW